jgi:hypothetical protein
MNFNEEKLKSILEDVCKVDYVYSYLPIIIKYSYPELYSYQEKLSKRSVIFTSQMSNCCDKYKEFVTFHTTSWIGSYRKGYRCKSCCYFLCEVFIGNIKVFDIITGNEVKDYNN